MEKTEKDKETEKEEPKEKWVTTSHKVKTKKETISYQAHTGVFPIKDKEEKIVGTIFFTAYLKQKAAKEKRALVFAFNGGPGSSSVWLHLGGLGPKKVQYDQEGFSLKPPAKLVDNPDTLLQYADVVFIDPISTGFSRSYPLKEAEKYHTVRLDMEVLAEFIRLFLLKFKRWSSPKFIAGESYGGTRAAYLAHHLEMNMGISLNGILFISPALNFQALYSEKDTNQIGYACLLPTLAATAWYHKKVFKEEKKVENVIRKAIQFVYQDYLLFLFKGNTATNEERDNVTKKLHQLTSLSEEFIRYSHQRITVPRFTKELLRKEFKTIGRLDGRFKGIDRDAAGEHYEFDPSYSHLQGNFTTAWNTYVSEDLQYENDAVYYIFSEDAYKNWKWTENPKEMGYLDFSDQLRQTLQYNVHLKLFIASGFYDLATPFFTTDFTVHHIGLDAPIEEKITTKYYEAGHMMYIKESILKQFNQDLGRFIEKSIET